jgi:hypothetical protein
VARLRWVQRTVGAPLCDRLRNAPALCRQWQGSPFEAYFGFMAVLGCRCPRTPGSYGALLVGTHHKTGTVLLEQLLLEIAKLSRSATLHKPRWTDCLYRSTPPPSATPPFGASTAEQIPLATPVLVAPQPLYVPSLCVDEHAKSVPAACTSCPVVHVIRDPLEVCVSSYQYALRSKESWLHKPIPALDGRSWQQHYKLTSTESGVLTECQRCLKEMQQMASLFAASATRPHVLHLRYEEFEVDFDQMVLRMLTFAGMVPDGATPLRRSRLEWLLRLTAKHDLSRRPLTERRAHEAAHVSNNSAKDALRTILRTSDSAVTRSLRALRVKLGYDTAGHAQHVRHASAPHTPVGTVDGGFASGDIQGSRPSAGQVRRWLVDATATD